MRRIAYAYGLATGLGVLLGLIMGRSKLSRDIVMPYLEILRPIPAVAWIPLAILMMPTEESSIVYITFLGALFPIVLNTIHGVEQTPEVLVRAARMLGIRPHMLLPRVVLPAAMPFIFTGLRLGIGLAWVLVIVAEMMAVKSGLAVRTTLSAEGSAPPTPQ